FDAVTVDGESLRQPRHALRRAIHERDNRGGHLRLALRHGRRGVHDRLLRIDTSVGTTGDALQYTLDFAEQEIEFERLLHDLILLRAQPVAIRLDELLIPGADDDRDIARGGIAAQDIEHFRARAMMFE